MNTHYYPLLKPILQTCCEDWKSYIQCFQSYRRYFINGGCSSCCCYDCHCYDPIHAEISLREAGLPAKESEARNSCSRQLNISLGLRPYSEACWRRSFEITVYHFSVSKSICDLLRCLSQNRLCYVAVVLSNFKTLRDFKWTEVYFSFMLYVYHGLAGSLDHQIY